MKLFFSRVVFAAGRYLAACHIVQTKHNDEPLHGCVGVGATGQRLNIANWTTTSMPAHMFKCAAEVTPPPAGLVSPLLWGDETAVQERLDGGFTDVRFSRKLYPQWHYPFDEHALVQLFREKFGPVKCAFELATPEQAEAMQDKLAEIYRNHSQTRDGVLTITGGEYLEVDANRR